METTGICSQGRRHVWLQWNDNGSVGICGQSLSDGGEYEWAFTVAPDDLPALWAAFGTSTDEDQETRAVAVGSRYSAVWEA
jgi:hypothetical protein